MSRSASRPILALLAVVLFGSVSAAQTPIVSGFRDFTYGSTAPTPTGEKPESKLWFNDGTWWGSLFNQAAQQYHIYRFDRPNQRWVDTGTVIDSRINSRADALWDDNSGKLYIVSHAYSSNAQATTSKTQWAQLSRYSYNTTSNTYSLDSGFPVAVNQGKAEALTIAKDSTGKLWITWVEGAKVKINHSNSSDLDWSAPATLPGSTSATTVGSDDISSVVAFAGNSIGVMWSNQLTSTTYFAWRRDSDGVSTWQTIETVLPDANCSSGACSDDHVNLKSDRWGRVFAAIKTSLAAGSQPLDMLAVRQADGSWSTYTVGLEHDHMTRPIVLLDEDANLLYYFFTIDESGGAIYFKTSPLDHPSFVSGPGTLLIKSTSDVTINNATSTKQSVDSSTGLLVAASDQNTVFYFHNLMALGAPAITSFTPTSGSSGTTVHVTGRGFLGTTAVTFDGTSATFSVISDTQVDATVPSSATSGSIKVTTAQGQGTSGSSFTVGGGGGGGGSSIKNITFEGGSLTNSTSGADRVTGPVSLVTSGPLKGSYSAGVTAANGYLEESFTAANNLCAALYVRLNALPSSDVRIVQLSDAGTTVGGIYLRADGRLRLKNGSTTIGSDSAPLAVGQIYRIGLRQQKGSGTNAVLQAFVVAGDGTLSSPFASTSAGTWTTAADRLRVGTTNGVALNFVVDNIALDSAVMPPPAP